MLAASRALLLAGAILAFGWNGLAAGSRTTIDATDTVVRIIDGDTFVGQRFGRVRLADVDAPELGEPRDDEATQFLRSLIHRRLVFLDVNGLHETDKYDRYVAVVYVEHNTTHLLNVNKALLEEGLARIADFPNEFDPKTWIGYVYYPAPERRPAVTTGASAISVAAILLTSMGIVLLILFRDRRHPE